MCAGGEREGLYISDGSLSLLSRDYGIDQFNAAAQSHQITTTLDGLMEEGGGKGKEGQRIKSLINKIFSSKPEEGGKRIEARRYIHVCILHN